MTEEGKIRTSLKKAVSSIKGAKCFNVSCNQYTGKGFPDVIILYKGESYYVELKAEGGKLSEQQKVWKEYFLNHKFNYNIITKKGGEFVFEYFYPHPFEEKDKSMLGLLKELLFSI